MFAKIVKKLVSFIIIGTFFGGVCFFSFLCRRKNVYGNEQDDIDHNGQRRHGRFGRAG